MKVFVTGITGFAGSYLAENLVSSGKNEVSGTYLSEESIASLTSIKDKVTLHKVDLQNYSEVKRIIADEKPERVFHLAALPSAGDSFKNPSEFINNNITVQVNVLEAIREAKIEPRVLIVSSAEVYGAVNASDLPIDEATAIRPVNPYAVSKVAQDFMGLQYFLSYKLPTIRVRPFNHIGPRQSTSFVVAAFAKKIADIEKGKMEPVLKVGNLSAKRDFTDVHDTMEAYVQALEKGTAGEVYNIGRGQSTEIQEILDKLLSFSSSEIKVEVDETLLRPIDVPELICDNTKIKSATGWEAKVPLDQTLKETLDYWRSQP